MASPSLPSPQVNSPAPTNEHLVFAFVVFSIVELVSAAWWAPDDSWPISLCLALPAGLGGATAWAMICGRRRHVGWWRAALAGCVGGLLFLLYLTVGLCVLAGLYPGDETPFEAIVGLIAALLTYYPPLFVLSAAAFMTLIGLVAGIIYRALGNFSANGIKTSSIKEILTSRVLRIWAAQFATAFVVFMIPGLMTAVTHFSTSQTWLATLASGLSGATAWILVCGRLRQPACWRAALSGVLAGILVHPSFWVLESLWSTSPTLGIYTNALGSFGDLGLVSVPAAILAGLACRAWGDYNAKTIILRNGAP